MKIPWTILTEKTDIRAHLPMLALLATETRKVIEVGVRKGVSTSAIMADRSIVYVGIDINKACSHVVQSLGGLFLHGTFKAVYDNIPPTACGGLVFIDSSHTYDDTLEESNLAVATGAEYIAYHDVELAAVRSAIAASSVASSYVLKYNNTADHGFAVYRKSGG